MRKNMTALRPSAMRIPNSLVALHDGVRDDAVEPNSRQRESQRSEGTKEPCDELTAGPLGVAGDPMFQVAYVAVRLLIVINGVTFNRIAWSRVRGATSERTRIWVYMPCPRRLNGARPQEAPALQPSLSLSATTPQSEPISCPGARSKKGGCSLTSGNRRCAQPRHHSENSAVQASD